MLATRVLGGVQAYFNERRTMALRCGWGGWMTAIYFFSEISQSFVHVFKCKVVLTAMILCFPRSCSPSYQLSLFPCWRYSYYLYRLRRPNPQNKLLDQIELSILFSVVQIVPFLFQIFEAFFLWVRYLIHRRYLLNPVLILDHVNIKIRFGSSLASLSFFTDYTVVHLPPSKMETIRWTVTSAQNVMKSPNFKTSNWGNFN